MQITAEVEIKPAQAKMQNLQLRIMQELQVAAWKGRGPSCGKEVGCVIFIEEERFQVGCC